MTNPLSKVLNMADTGEPFGLPAGTVRGVIALAFTGTFIYMGATGAIGPDVLLAAGLPYLGYYVADRKAADTAKAIVAASNSDASGNEPLGAPSIPGEEE